MKMKTEYINLQESSKSVLRGTFIAIYWTRRNISYNNFLI